jgi:SAM-dependent methyltransferase
LISRDPLSYSTAKISISGTLLDNNHPIQKAASAQSALGSAGWIEFWNKDCSIYVSDRHKRVHYQTIATDIARLLPEGGSNRVLDFGCGEALSAEIIAKRTRELVLCDAAPTVRDGLKRRFAADPKIMVVSPDEVAAMPEASFDAIVANSVLQYVSRDQLSDQLARWRRLLTPDGQLILGDIIPTKTGMIADAGALLTFAAKNGFLMPACAGLARTFFSDYRTKRAELGLLQLDEQDVIAVSKATGLAAVRQPHNIGHNPNRMTFVARPQQA